jgi:hypothetical protein
LKKVMFLAIVCILASAVTAQASDYSWVKGGALSYLTSNSTPTLYFSGNAGDNVAVIMMPLGSPSMAGYCGLASFSDPGNLIVTADSGLFAVAALPTSDLYVFTCIQTGGSDGNVLLVAADNDVLGITSTSRAASSYTPNDLNARLLEAIHNIVGSR